ncbi:olfactory receptor 10G4-like [Colossoma macropomum]|uniref:olfactory receptor 10G4-like n=1 Tax=Colossoma macropomum TaxID=42526 RepID=UPI001864A34B|nr:olfactory receptor 10G4-like [Colossoma macropomum]
MSFQNISRQAITEFVFKGFDTVQSPLVVGVVMLILYILVMITNTANICFIVMDKRLHQQMYLFICNLALVDIVFCTSACPTMIGVLVVRHNSISYAPCIVQMFLFYFCSLMEAFAISVMAFDRFIAISTPLRYHSILTNVRCVLISIVLWLAGSAIMAVLPATVVPLQVCYSTVKYMFCDYASVIRATCVDPEPYFNMLSILTSVLIFGMFSFICLSYIKIVIVVARMTSKSDKKKAFNTCFSHLIVVICFYAPTFIRTVLTRIGVVLTMEERNGLIVGSILGPSLINPFIYCFRTKEIRKKLFKLISKAIFAEKRKQYI